MPEQKKILVVYYSRSGTTRRVAEEVAKELGADIEGIQDAKSRKGLFGWLRSGFEAHRKSLPEIRPFRRDAAQYDLVVLASPIWAGLMASPMRTWLSSNKAGLRSVALVTTSASTDYEAALSEMAEFIGKKPVATLGVVARQVKTGKYLDSLKAFAAKLR
ncbi:MAG: NAD(P)H-dependent oxidoreductase [candidate division WOR-3 bacterium]